MNFSIENLNNNQIIISQLFLRETNKNFYLNKKNFYGILFINNFLK